MKILTQLTRKEYLLQFLLVLVTAENLLNDDFLSFVDEPLTSAKLPQLRTYQNLTTLSLPFPTNAYPDVMVLEEDMPRPN